MSLGSALLITGGVDEREVPFKLISTIGTGRFLDQIPYLVIIAWAVALVFGVALAVTRFGRYTYAVGSNEEGTRRAGVAVDRHLITRLRRSAGCSPGWPASSRSRASARRRSAATRPTT